MHKHTFGTPEQSPERKAALDALKSYLATSDSVPRELLAIVDEHGVETVLDLILEDMLRHRMRGFLQDVIAKAMGEDSVRAQVEFLAAVPDSVSKPAAHVLH